MSKSITRRDFLNGVSLSIAGAVLVTPGALLGGGIRPGRGWRRHQWAGGGLPLSAGGRKGITQRLSGIASSTNGG